MWEVAGGCSRALVSTEAIGFPLAMARMGGGDCNASVRQALPMGRSWQAEVSSGELRGRTRARSGSAGNPAGQGSGEEPASQEAVLGQGWVSFSVILGVFLKLPF